MAELIAFQVAVVLFSFFAWSRVLLRAKERKISLLTASFWSCVWVIIVLVALLPSILITIAQSTGIGRGVDLLIYLSIGLLFYLVFKQFVYIKELRRKMSELISNFAIENEKSKAKK